MNSKETERQYNLRRWAAIISECRASGEKILNGIKKHNISKDLYYYWQGKVKNACIDSIQQPAFVEINTENIPANT